MESENHGEELKLGGFQLDLEWENPEANYARASELIGEALPTEGSLVALPELFATGFTMDTGLAESDPSPTEAFLSALAQERSIYLLGGVARRDAIGAVKNQSVVFSPEGVLISRYSKIHGFSLAGESDSYAEGSDIFLFEWNGFRVAHFICYDLRFPELFRAAARMGANMFIVIASWPVARIAHWTQLLRARAIENQAYVLGVNRCGSDPNFEYCGCSEIIDFSGKTLVSAGSAEGFIEAVVDVEALTEYRKRLPFLEDMRGVFFGS